MFFISLIKFYLRLFPIHAFGLSEKPRPSMNAEKKPYR